MTNVDVTGLADLAETMLGPLQNEPLTSLTAAAHSVTSTLPHDNYVQVVEELQRRQGQGTTRSTMNGSSGGTLAELLEKQIPPVRYVVHNLIPEGLTLLAGKPKLGKSWLALGISLGVCAGVETLGHWTEEGEVLYIALEDGERRMQDRVRILDGHLLGDSLHHFHYRTTWETFDRGALDQLEKWMRDHPDTRLIVVDTYGKIQGEVAGKDRYSEEYRLLGGLQTFATIHRVAVILVHHLRKQGADDWLEQLSGSQAITGAADTLLGLFRERGLMDATLRLVSRDLDEADYALKFDGGRWESMGDATQYRTTVERGEIIDALESMGGTGKVGDIANLTGRTSASTSKLLAGLEVEGTVTRIQYGIYALTHTVEVVEPIPSTSTTSTALVSLEKPLQPLQPLQLINPLQEEDDPW